MWAKGGVLRSGVLINRVWAPDVAHFQDEEDNRNKSVGQFTGSEGEGWRNRGEKNKYLF